MATATLKFECPAMVINWPKEGWKPMLIYISAPYSLGDVVSNVRFACEIGDQILAKGHIPLVPHLTHFWHFLSPKSWEEWLRIDQCFLARCDAVLRIDGESKGADMEVQLAKDLGIPVFYSLEEVPNVSTTKPI